MSFHAVSIYFPTQVLYNNNVFINKQTVNEVKMRILICDDDPLMIEQLKKYCKNFFDKIHVKCPELACFSDGESLLADKGDKDILFLDINMKDAVELYNTMTIKIPVETKQGIHTLSASDIIAIEAQARKVVVHTTLCDFESVHNMQYWLKELPKNCFFQTHRSFIINFEHVTDFDHTLVNMAGNQIHAYLTKRKYSAFKEAYLLYLESTR